VLLDHRTSRVERPRCGLHLGGVESVEGSGGRHRQSLLPVLGGNKRMKRLLQLPVQPLHHLGSAISGLSLS
jgi:hypothetical protein